LDEADIFTGEINTLFKGIEKNPNVDWFKIQLDVHRIVRWAIENTIQHGSIADGDSSRHGAQVNAKFGVYLEGADIFVVIKNPKIKPFPISLDREFLPGEKANVTEEERVGFKGTEEAVGLILDKLASFPAGSSVKWESDSEAVEFVLRINIQ
jgi:hypothetical protein